MGVMAVRRVPVSTRTALLSTNATEILDSEANRQQLDMVSQQMEDAMHKEKMMMMSSSTKQPNPSSEMYDFNETTDMYETMPPTDTKEVEEIARNPGNQTRPRVGDDVEKPGKEQGKDEVHRMMDQVKGVATGTSHVLMDKAKHTMQSAKEIAQEVLKADPTGKDDAEAWNRHDDMSKPRCKQYSEHRQNASLL